MRFDPHIDWNLQQSTSGSPNPSRPGTEQNSWEYVDWEMWMNFDMGSIWDDTEISEEYVDRIACDWLYMALPVPWSCLRV